MTHTKRARPARPAGAPPANPPDPLLAPGADPTRLADLLPDPKNRRTHGARNAGMMADALRQVGAARSIVIDERGEVLAGNGIVQAARSVGLSKLHVVDVDGDTVVAVRRRGLTDEQKRRLAIYDNRTAELAEWDVGQLAEDFIAGDDLAPFWTDEELAKLKVTPKTAPVGTQPLDGAFAVMVTCTDEAQQTALLERFKEEGLECKALVS